MRTQYLANASDRHDLLLPSVGRSRKGRREKREIRTRYRGPSLYIRRVPQISLLHTVDCRLQARVVYMHVDADGR